VWGLPWPTLLAAFTVGVIAVARLTRLVVDDDWPPMVWFRRKWDRLTENSTWSVLVECYWCVSPYIAAVDIGWAILANLHWTWWLVNGWLAVSWLASYMCFRDIPADKRG
jgi:hypothetical protein